MSGHGERPAEDDGEQDAEQRAKSLAIGEALYNSDGERVGSVRGHEQGGVFVTTREGMEELSVEHARSGHYFGEAHLMWRCTNCGEMGTLDDGQPDHCPNCGVEQEHLMWWKED